MFLREFWFIDSRVKKRTKRNQDVLSEYTHAQVLWARTVWGGPRHYFVSMGAMGQEGKTANQLVCHNSSGSQLLIHFSLCKNSNKCSSTFGNKKLRVPSYAFKGGSPVPSSYNKLRRRFTNTCTICSPLTSISHFKKHLPNPKPPI